MRKKNNNNTDLGLAILAGALLGVLIAAAVFTSPWASIFGGHPVHSVRLTVDDEFSTDVMYLTEDWEGAWGELVDILAGYQLWGWENPEMAEYLEDVMDADSQVTINGTAWWVEIIEVWFADGHLNITEHMVNWLAEMNFLTEPLDLGERTGYSNGALTQAEFLDLDATFYIEDSLTMYYMLVCIRIPIYINDTLRIALPIFFVDEPQSTHVLTADTTLRIDALTEVEDHFLPTVIQYTWLPV